MGETRCENCEHSLEAQDPVICAGCYNELALEAREARRFYAADGTFVELEPAEVKRRRVGAAGALIETQRALARSVVTERDHLAAMAMQGLIAASGADPKQFPDTQDAFAAAIAQEAYAVADAVLREREKQSNRKET